MRNISLLLTILLLGCTATPETAPKASSLSGFQTVDYQGLSNLNMHPTDVARYLFDDVCDNDFFSSIAASTSDGVVGSNANLTLYRFHQTYHDSPVWNTKIELVFNTTTRVVEKASLLVVDPAKLKQVPQITLSSEEGLSKIEALFLAADEAPSYELMEPLPVYFYNRTTNQWHLGWGSRVVSQHDGYNQTTGQLVLVTLTYSIIVDGITGEQLLFEFGMN